MTEEHQEYIAYRNPVESVGFAQLNHVMALDRELSDGAYRTYGLYIKYAQQKDNCFPGVERLAKERGKSPATISRHNAELEKLGYITRVRRIGTSSMTYIEDVHQIPRLKPIADRELKDREPTDDVTNLSPVTRRTSHKRDGKNNKVNNNKSKNISSVGTEKESPPTPVQGQTPIQEKLPDCENLNKNGKPLTEHQQYFKALAKAFNLSLDLMVVDDRGRMNKYAKQIREAKFLLPDIHRARQIWDNESWGNRVGMPPKRERDFSICLETARQERLKREAKLKGGYG